MWTSESRRDVERDVKLNVLTDLASADIENLLGELGVVAYRRGRRLVGACPVHGGQNPTAFNLYPDGDRVRCIWLCRTQGCHTRYKETLIGLVRGVLTARTGREIPFWEAVHWLCRFLNVRYHELRVDVSGQERRAFVGAMELLSPVLTTPKATPVADVAARLEIPSPYFLSRGYSETILRRYLVGEPRNPNPASPFHMRAVVPVFSDDTRGIIGYTGRSLYPRCKGCGRWHAPELDCPPPRYRHGPRYAKWRHSDSLPVRETLYNLHSARHRIRQTGTVVLVEGPGDVWRLVEAGLENVVAVFGKTLEDPQQVLLEKLGVTNILLMLDADESGSAGAKEMLEVLRTIFSVRVVVPPAKDVGEMQVCDLKEFLRDEHVL